MASLTGNKVKDTYQSLLKTNDNGQVTSVSKNITDGFGSGSGLYLKDTGVALSGSVILQGISIEPQTNVLTYDTASGEIYYTASSAIGGGAALTQNLTTNITVGALTSGTSYNVGEPLETLLRAMLVTYIAPTIGNFTLFNGGSSVLAGSVVREVGSALGPFNTASFAATVDNPNGRFAYSSSFTASGASTGNFDVYFGDNVLASSNNFGLGGSQTVNRMSNGTVTFTLNARNPQTMGTISQTRTVTYVYPFFYGMSATDYSTTGDLSGDGDLVTLVQTSGNKSLSINGTAKYVYFAYPASYGNLTSIKDGNNFEILTAFTKYTRNQAGSGGGWTGISYNIYRSNTVTTVSPAQTYVFTF